MGINNIIKNSFLNNFSDTISLSTVITTGEMSLLFAFVVYIVYLLTCDKTIYSKKFNVAMSLMTVITSALVMAMQANIVISLGMVGALSIVRFRTAVKDPRDTAFIFWGIVVGLSCGTQCYYVAIIGSIFVCALAFVFKKFVKNDNNYVLIVRGKDFNTALIEKILNKNIKSYVCKSK